MNKPTPERDLPEGYQFGDAGQLGFGKTPIAVPRKTWILLYRMVMGPDTRAAGCACYTSLKGSRIIIADSIFVVEGQSAEPARRSYSGDGNHD